MAEINPMNNPVLIASPAVLEATLVFLQDAGVRSCEGVVLWLGRKEGDGIRVVEAYVPEQETSDDSFRIGPSSMAALLRHLGDTNMFIAAQVHSHPREAFHSVADDTWAIVRHLGALSLVAPHFARTTSIANFLQKIAAFRLNADNVWEELTAAELLACIRI